MNRQKLIKLISIWLGIAIGLATFLIVTLDWPKWHGLAQRAIKTEGIVTAKEPYNHEIIRYSFKIGSQTYSGLGPAGGANAEFNELKVGDKIKVFYDSNNPDVSRPDSATDQSSSIIMVVLFAIIVGPIMGFSGLYKKGWLPVM